MKIVSTTDPVSVETAVTVLKNGGVIVYPTDTAYGLGGDAMSHVAIEKIKEIKRRDDRKPIPALVSDIEQAKRLAVFDSSADLLANKYWPGALTLVLSLVDGAIGQVLGGKTVMGIRVPNHDWCRAMARELGSPVTSTSANASGTAAEYSIEGVARSLGEMAEKVDLWIDGGTLAGGPVSTVVRIENEEVVVQREGAISKEEIEATIKK